MGGKKSCPVVKMIGTGGFIMKVIDLSHTISESMPYYPGTDPPTFKNLCTIERDGFAEKKITMMTHTGTHMDAPSHILSGAPSLDLIGPENFCGRGVVLDFTDFSKPTIGPADLEPHRTSVEASQFILLHTGWNKYWNTDEYYQNFPCLSPEGAKWIGQFQPKGVGVDTISVDPTGITGFSVHQALLKRGIMIIENLNNLEKLIHSDFFFCCFPLKIAEADGSPVRAMAITGMEIQTRK